MPTSKPWSRPELLLSLNLYHKLPFGQLHARNPVIISLGEKLGRGANSVAMKLCNFASLDPALQLRGIKGLAGASKLDATVWAEFHADLEETVRATEDSLRQLFSTPDDADLEVLPQEGIRIHKSPPTGLTETIAPVKVRRGQEYFRDAVLNNFGGRCGITELAIRELLVASHILPWGTHPAERLNPGNGLALTRLHDAAFDRGFITFDDQFRLQLSPKLTAHLPSRSIADNFTAYAGHPLHLPADAALPNPKFLATHRTQISQRQ